MAEGLHEAIIAESSFRPLPAGGDRSVRSSLEEASSRYLCRARSGPSADGLVLERKRNGRDGGRGDADRLRDGASLAFAADIAVPAGRPYVAGGIDRDVSGRTILKPVVVAESWRNGGSGRGEFADAAVAPIGDPEVAVAVDGDGGGIVEAAAGVRTSGAGRA